MADTQRPGRLGLADELAARAASITVGDLLVRQALAGPDRIAVEDGTRRLTYAEFNERVNRSAHALAALGVRRGDRIGILSENRAEYVELLGAAAKLGAILATLNWRLRPRELEGVIGVSTPSVIVVSRDSAPAHSSRAIRWASFLRPSPQPRAFSPTATCQTNNTSSRPGIR